MDDQLIQDLLKIEAVKIEVDDMFTWTSGLRSPIYCDNRMTMSYPEIRRRVADGFVELIKELELDVDVIAGCATAGIPHAAWVAERLDLPMVYVRSSPKKHGKENQIEGHIEKGQRAVVIEDLISTGKSSIESAQALRMAGVEVEKVLSIFTYNLERANEAFLESELSYQSLASFDQLLLQLIQQGQLKEKEVQLLNEWKKDPAVFTQN
ncbi:orotate phosphoribosyltransferase [Halobacillus halophilus]|uniref:Orotate phosphoribosyltransferase n=1 Tax=Halobacillus halophilus (strain ATCC 35676 / DSM 2266 / JCM 20832 / KCTC 3685 / LMG 17431 / NBRC 102448 / NCIMB 2269) TaxID=866895 RepID=I0JM81_HALH3|nr:orotate phosphoribosyltransferase [Halobacillus halophilus]ASF39339.1 orotate phosphoribosyltransferase [Halobacillus halophilus]CCG45251.1 orotate phosphoribosyltransferase [Halobacillus halophilus DSM 2266]